MYGCSVWCSQGKGRFTDLCAPVSLLADRSSSVINDLSSYQITVYIQRVNKAFCIFNYYVQYLCNYGCSLLQFWSMIVCTQASIGSSLRNYIRSIVVKCTSRQSRTEAILFIFYQSKSKVNGIMVCIPVGQFCQFLIFLIILYWSNVNTSARNHVSIICY